ncbi:MAG: hydrolase [Pseudomonadota bacterium]
MIKQSQFRPATGLGNRHLQTILASSPARPRPAVPLRRETLELPDGDFVHVDWVSQQDSDDQRPLMLVLHGLEGSVRSRYAASVLHAANRGGLGAALLNARGCSGVPNRKAAAYHAGHTADFDFFLQDIKRRWPGRPVVAVGYSLGGNALLKYVGQQGSNCALHAAVAVSVPFDLTDSAGAIDSGFARFYQWILMRRMRASVERKLPDHEMPVTAEQLPTLRSFSDFDERVTAPLHGFASGREYYEQSSCGQYLSGIQIPTLIIHAKDDPFMTPACVPSADMLSEHVTLELSTRGGHVGFLEGGLPFRLRSWLEPRILAHFREHLAATTATNENAGDDAGESLTATG